VCVCVCVCVCVVCGSVRSAIKQLFSCFSSGIQSGTKGRGLPGRVARRGVTAVAIRL
jgi:hypothetical protein